MVRVKLFSSPLVGEELKERGNLLLTIKVTNGRVLI